MESAWFNGPVNADDEFKAFMQVMRLNADNAPYDTLAPGMDPFASIYGFLELLADRIYSENDAKPTSALADKAVAVIMDMRSFKLDQWMTFGDSMCILTSGTTVVLRVEDRNGDNLRFFRVNREAVDGMREHIKTKMYIMSTLESILRDSLPVAVNAYNEVIRWISNHVDQIDTFNVDTKEATITYKTV